MVAFVNKSLSQELFDVLNILFLDNFRESSKSICLKHVIIGLLNIFGQATDNDENFIFIYVKFLDEHVHESSQVLVKLVSLWLWNLKKFGNIEEHLTFLVFGKDLTLIQQENNLVKKVDTFLFFQSFVIENVGLLHESWFVQIRIRVFVFRWIVYSLSCFFRTEDSSSSFSWHLDKII